MTGYMDQGRQMLGATYLGENVSMDKSLEANDSRLFASPGHHQNIVDPRFNYIGIGVALDANDWVYVTEDFSQIPHGMVALGVKQAATPAAPPAQPASEPASSPPVSAPAPAPPRPAAPALSPQAAAPPAPAPPAPAVSAPAVAAPASAGGPTAARPPDPFAASLPAAAFPFANLIQGVTVPAPVGSPPAEVPGGPTGLAAAAQALPTAAPRDDVVPSGSAAIGGPQPLVGWMSPGVGEPAPSRRRGRPVHRGALLPPRRPRTRRAAASRGPSGCRVGERSTAVPGPEFRGGDPGVAEGTA